MRNCIGSYIRTLARRMPGAYSFYWFIGQPITLDASANAFQKPSLRLKVEKTSIDTTGIGLTPATVDAML